MTTNDPTPEHPNPGTPPTPPPPPPVPPAASAPPPAAPPPSAPPPNYAQQPVRPAPTVPGFPPPRESDETTWAMLAQLSIFVLGLIGPLLIMLIGGQQRPFARAHAVEALNFHLTLLFAFIGGFILFLVGFVFWPLLIVVTLAWIAISIAAIVFAILAAIKAASGEGYRYPWTLRLVS